MRGLRIPTLLLCAAVTAAVTAVAVTTPALADGRHHRGHGHGHHHHRVYERVVRYEPYVVVRPAPVRYWREPVPYYYHEVHRHRDHHDHDDAYKWLGAAIVVGEIIHHTQGAHR